MGGKSYKDEWGDSWEQWGPMCIKISVVVPRVDTDVKTSHVHFKYVYFIVY